MSGTNAGVSFNALPAAAEIRLTGSKSESNRALILEALSNGRVRVENLSEAADTVTLKALVTELAAGGHGLSELNVGPAGTAMRFLTAYTAIKGIPAPVTITGSERMKQRPIGILTDALRTLGANISFPENNGFPPVTITGPFSQKTNCLTIRGNVSSQYLTALLLIAPALPQGLQLSIEGDLTSRPYVEMTLGMLAQCGIRHNWNADTIAVSPQEFLPATLIVEPDWSAASYWYSIAALSDHAVISLPYLRKNSLQGDSVIANIMSDFGVITTFTETGLTLEKQPAAITRDFFDLKDCPDLAQTVIVCCAALGHNATFTGLETLKIKETDRISALQKELAKIGVRLTEKNEQYHLDTSSLNFPGNVFIHTYEDHRMAMAFAPLAMKIHNLEIEDHNVVAKSYPEFWKHLELAGFIVNY
jgi:3-phosphoshikimate 1-carboxyvinyltransferase